MVFYIAMEIISNYSNYAANNVDTTKKCNKKCNKNSNSNAATSSEDKVQEYYEQLCKKFSQMDFNTSGDITSSSKHNIVLNLSNDCLKKMASDPDFARKIESDIAGIPDAHKQMFAKAKSDGIEIQGFSVRINADGSMQCSCSGSTRTSGSKQNSTILTRKRNKRLEKKREERNILERKAKKSSSTSAPTGAGFDRKA